MSVWAIADLHLSFGVPDKGMELFGEHWRDHFKTVANNWTKNIAEDDLVLIAGDISWAMHPEQALPDLEWIHKLPGTKVLIRGNHDFWWTSLSKVAKVLPSSLHLIQNNAFNWKGIAIAGARLWDTAEYKFHEFVDYRDNPKARTLATEAKPDDEKIFQRELQRLETSLKAMDRNASKRIVMTHYPPIGAELAPTMTSALLEKYHVDICVFGHLHNLKPQPLFGNTARGVSYFLTACDYLNFCPLKVL